jgi:hypothetical protein
VFAVPRSTAIEFAVRRPAGLKEGQRMMGI